MLQIPATLQVQFLKAPVKTNAPSWIPVSTLELETAVRFGVKKDPGISPGLKFLRLVVAVEKGREDRTKQNCDWQAEANCQSGDQVPVDIESLHFATPWLKHTAEDNPRPCVNAMLLVLVLHL
jgi:hypothetical protein